MTLSPQLRENLALKGAAARLKEIDEEVKAIYEAFPELRGGLKGAGKTSARPKRVMSPEVRKRMSAGMRRFWARRKNAAKSGAKAKAAE